ncbi:MAG: hypothetical protein ACYC63_11990 [Armatimonadota bacterium]
MSRKAILCVCGMLLAATLLSSCARKPAPEPYVRIEPSGKPAPGQMTVQQGLTEEELGIAYYPAAKVNKSGLVQGAKGAVAGAELQTEKPYAEVVNFYRGKYQAHKPTVKALDDPAGPTTILNWQDMRGNYTVVIKRDNAGKQTVVTLAKTSR